MAETRCLSIGFKAEMTPRKTKSKAQRQAYEKAGRRAENLACLYLRLKGYRILPYFPPPFSRSHLRGVRLSRPQASKKGMNETLPVLSMMSAPNA